MSIEELMKHAMTLPDGDRLELAEQLIGSIEHLNASEVEAAWDVEIDRRIEDVEKGHVKLIEHDEAMKQMFGEDA